MTASPNEPLRVKAPAKINLTLAVHERRSDGYHDLESWVVCVDLFDDLAFRPATSFQLEIVNDDSIPTDDRNLVHRAAHALAGRAGIEPNVSIRVHKRIPAGAGLGGGSSDAAACLIGLKRLWGLELTVDELSAIGARIGSDVPLFVRGGQLVMRGRGERIESLARSIEGWVVLICPTLHVSTAEVYAAYAQVNRDRVSAAPWEMDDLNSDRIAGRLFNDLESAACTIEPELRRLHVRLDGLNDRPVRVTGSGSAMFALFRHERDARSWASDACALVDDAAVLVHRILPNTIADQI